MQGALFNYIFYNFFFLTLISQKCIANFIMRRKEKKKMVIEYQKHQKKSKRSWETDFLVPFHRMPIERSCNYISLQNIS